MTNFRKRATARKYVKSGLDYTEEWANAQANLHAHSIEEGIEALEKYANTARPELVNVGDGQFQVWIRRDRAVCFRAYRAASQ